MSTTRERDEAELRRKLAYIAPTQSVIDIGCAMAQHGREDERRQTVAYLVAIRGGLHRARLRKDTAKNRHRIEMVNELIAAFERGEHAEVQP